jgi:DNA-binding protein YbaB
MFDIFSKINEIKDKALKAKEDMEAKEFIVSDSKNYVLVKSNGKKDILSIDLKEGFDSLSLDEKQALINEVIKKALSESESYFVNTAQNIVPNIPGFNIFG